MKKILGLIFFLVFCIASSLVAAQNEETEVDIESAKLLDQEFKSTATSVELWIRFRNSISSTTGNERTELEKLITEIQSGSKISKYSLYSDNQIESFKVLLNSLNNEDNELDNKSLALHVACFTNPIRYKSASSALQESKSDRTAEENNKLHKLLKLRSDLLTQISENLKYNTPDQIKIYRMLDKIDAIDEKIAENTNHRD